MHRSQKILTLLRIQFESANQKNKFLAVTRVVATTSGLFRFSDLFLRKPQHFKSSNGKNIL